MNALADRRFQHVLGLSVLLHGALFVALPRPSVTPPAMPQLVASIRLVMPEVSMPAPAPAPAAQPAPVQEALQAPAAAPRSPRAERAEARPVLATPQPARPALRQALAARGLACTVTREVSPGELPVQLVEQRLLPTFADEEVPNAAPILRQREIR